jgi:heat shock protein HtpX
VAPVGERQRPSLAGRAILAVALLVGFYLLALAIAAGLLFLVYAEVAYGERINVRLTVFAVVGAVIILWSLLPRVDRFQAPGPRLAAREQPRLFQLIGRIAGATGQDAPQEVYVVPDMNAWVAQRGGVMGMGSRRVMGLGLPLLNRLTVAQLAAVLAHEFGHFYGGDTALGPWVYKTRAAIGRTLKNLSSHSQLLMKPFEWYGTLFLRITHAISRAQEYSADALAARVVGAKPLAEGLKTVHGAGVAFDTYWNEEYAPALRSGFRPPFQQGFQSFVSNERVAQAVQKVVAAELAQAQANPFDTHPPLRDRVAALASGGVVKGWEDDALAATLLDDAGRVEQQLIASIVGPEMATKLQPVTWTDVPQQVWVPAWARVAREHASRLKGVTPARLAELAAHPASLAVALKFSASPEVTSQAHVAEAAGAFGSALTVALVSAGWELTAGPGEPVRLRRNAHEIRPFDAWSQILSGEISREGWRSLCEQSGIAGLDLGTIAPA